MLTRTTQTEGGDGDPTDGDAEEREMAVGLFSAAAGRTGVAGERWSRRNLDSNEGVADRRN